MKTTFDPISNKYEVLQPSRSEKELQTLCNFFDINADEDMIAVILSVRQFYDVYAHSPTNRVLMQYIRQQHPLLSTLDLQINLPGSPALVLAYLAGIPKPKNCF